MLNRTVIKKGLKYIFLYSAIFVASFSLCKINIKGNYFIFCIPWVIFCFLNNKNYGFFSLIVSSFFIGSYNKFYFILMLIVIVSLVICKNLIKRNNKNLGTILSFYCFFIVFIAGVLIEVFFKTNGYLFAFLLGVISYWIMRYFYDIYLTFNSGSKSFLLKKSMTFIFFILGLSFFFLKLKIFTINISLILIVLLVLIASKVSLENGILFSFLMSLFMFDYEIVAFFVSAVLIFLLDKTSKLTLFFTYIFVMSMLVYYLNLDYFLIINYLISIVIYLFIPYDFINKISEFCYGSDKYINKIIDDNKRINMHISNKILKMEEIFSIFTSKIDNKSRMKKNEKDIFLEEIKIYDNLLKQFSSEVKGQSLNKSSGIEEEIYRLGFDLLSFDIKEDVFKEKVIKLTIRCEKRDIFSIIIPRINKICKCKFVVNKIKHNDVFGFYIVTLGVEKEISFNYGVQQKSKQEEACGDSYLVYENEEKKMFVLSDGMGSGKEAKSRSLLAIDLFKKFMDVGFEEMSALNSINYFMKKKSEKEGYVTLDLLVYDKCLGKFYFFKNGASNSYIFSEENLSVIEGNDLPIGIVDKVEFKKKEVEISNNSYIVMVSDGVSESDIEAIRNIKNNNCQKIAKQIVGTNIVEDDKTVIVINIKK